MSSMYGANLMLDRLFGSGTPTVFYLAALYSRPGWSTPGSALDEPSADSYGRVAVDNTVANFPAAANGEQTNGQDVVFPPAVESWGVIRAFALCTESTGGQVVTSGNSRLTIVQAGSTLRFPRWTLSMTLR